MSERGNSPGAVAMLIVLPLLLGQPAAADEGCAAAVPLDRLLAEPNVYHGKPVWVVAEVTIEFEGMTACGPGKAQGRKPCLWLTLDDGPHDSDRDRARYDAKLRTWEAYHLQTIAIRATFDKDSKGHFGMYPGSLRNVTQVLGHDGGWSFTAQAPVPHRACAARLGLPKQPDGLRAMLAGQRKLRNRDFDGAIADFTRAIALDPSNIGYLLTRAAAREKKRDYAGAVADYTRAIELAREDKDVMYLARAEVKERAGDLDGAMADCSEAIELNPRSPDGLRCRGRLKQKQGDVGGAEADFGRAKELAPAKPQANRP